MWVHSRQDAVSTAPAGSDATVALALPSVLMAEGLARLLLDHDMRVVGCAETHAALLELVALRAADLIVVDADLIDGPEGPGRALAALRTCAPASRIVVLADTVGSALARVVMACGAHGVILKSSPTADAVATLVRLMQQCRTGGR